MVTIRDIASRAGVSIGTVDRIIHNRGRFSAQTAKRVHKIVNELGYRPNQIARHLSRATQFRVAVLVPHPEQDSYYWALPLAGIRKAERELADFGLSVEVVHFDRYREGDFLRAAHRLVRGEFEACAVTPLSPEAARAFLTELPSDRPVMFFDTDVPGTRRTGFIGQESTQSGRLAARLLSMAMGAGNSETGRVVVVAPNEDNHHLASRIAGFSEGMSRQPEVLRISIESDRQSDRLFASLERAAVQDAAGLFVADASVHYVAEFLSRTRSRPALVGYDLVPDNRRWLAAGGIDFLLTQRPVAQGYSAIARLFRAGVLSEPVPDSEFTPIDIVTKENLPFVPEEDT